MERYNDWMSYSFDDGPINGPKPTATSTFKLHFKQGTEYKKMSYYDALFYNARMMKDNYSEPFDVLLSGGIDSEVVVRTFKQEGIKQNVYTFRFENDINIKDVNSAIQIAKDADIKLNIIDWNLQKFFENDAYDLFQKTYSIYPARMLRHAWFDLLDNIPVMCEGEPYWRRELRDDFSEKSKWYLWWVEDYFTASIYANTVGRTIIGEWYNYTPEIVMSYHKLPLVKKLIADNIPGKQSSWSSRTEIHRHLWPSIVDKPKLVGYEGPDRPPGQNPDFMIDFYLEVVHGTNNKAYRYSKKELENIFK
jgi:hypothetical protein